MQSSSYLQVHNYFKDLVSQSNFLNDFVGLFDREWATRTNSPAGIQSPVLTLYKYDLGFEGSGNNTIAVRKVALSIIFNDVKDDFASQYQAIQDAEALALKLVSRINHDNYVRNHLLYNSFLKETVEMFPEELSAKQFGVSVMFSIKNPQVLSLNPDDWKDLDKACP